MNYVRKEEMPCANIIISQNFNGNKKESKERSHEI